MEPEQFTVLGNLAYRSIKNFARLEDHGFLPEIVLSDPTFNDGWPGDKEGRVMLAYVLLGRLTHREPAFLDRYYRLLVPSLNQDGYRGPIEPGVADEQGLAGHNWLMRALLEHHLWKHDSASMDLARGIVDHLYLPLSGRFADYPIDPALRTMEGRASGTLDGKIVCGWKTSTDIGCAFIALDALSQYHQITRDPRVESLIDEMIVRFQTIDLVASSMQTHATLSALRGILRYGETTGQKGLLDFAICAFEQYLNLGISECYANHNWFGRPLWTEPCAIVDSYIVAIELFKRTGQGRYADIANRIYHSAFLHAQRANGGFGCDSCVGCGEHPEILRCVIPEAHWCCSMRGAEGLYAAARNVFHSQGEQLILIHPIEGIFEAGRLRLQVTSGFPHSGNLCVQAERIAGGARTLSVYLPSSDGLRVTIDGSETTASFMDHFATVALPEESRFCVQLSLPIGLEVRAPINAGTRPDLRSLWHGTLLLATPTDESVIRPLPSPDSLEYMGQGCYALDGQPLLFPIADQIDQEGLKPMQVLFPIGKAHR